MTGASSNRRSIMLICAVDVSSFSRMTFPAMSTASSAIWLRAARTAASCSRRICRFASSIWRCVSACALAFASATIWSRVADASFRIFICCSRALWSSASLWALTCASWSLASWAACRDCSTYARRSSTIRVMTGKPYLASTAKTTPKERSIQNRRPDSGNKSPMIVLF